MTQMARISLVVCVFVSVIVIEGGAFTSNAADLRRIVTFNNLSDQLLYKVTWSLGDGITTIKLVHDLSLIKALAIQLPTLGADQALAFLLNLVVQGVAEGVYEDTVGMVDGGRYPVCIDPAPPPAPQSYPWGQEQIYVHDVHQEEPELKGTNVTVAVMDTGIASHPELSGRIGGGYNALAGGGSSTDDNGHGTHMAGIIGADLKEGSNSLLPGIIGTAPQATLLPVKVLDQYGAGYLSDVINGLQWVYNNGSPRAKVANMSVGFLEDNPPLLQAIQRLSDSGVIMVASAGNRCAQSPGQDEGGDDCQGGPALDCDPAQDAVRYPAAYQAWVIAVEATDIDGNITAYSLSGPQVDMAAPGGSKATGRILSTNKGSCAGGCYGWGSGTSQAAAHVSGAVTLALQLQPGISFQQVRLCLQATAEGPGRINVKQLVQALLAGQCP